MPSNKVILLIDDNKDFSDEFSKLSFTYGVITVHKTNYKDMVDSLPTLYNKICCVVLDINCLMEPSQEIEKPDFLGKAISYLDQNYNTIPRVILTAIPAGYDDVKKYFAEEKVFMKTSADIINMLQYIDSLDIESVKIRSIYSDVFEIVEKSLLSIETETQIIDLLKKSESKDYSDILDCLAKIRRIQESIFQTINKSNKSILPDDLFKENKDIKFRDIHKYLKGNPSFETKHQPTTEVYYSGPIANFSEVIYRVASDYGSHNQSDTIDYPPTTYTVKALIYSLMDFIRWFGSLNLRKS